MSSFNCEHCGTPIIDTHRGYVTGCPHWPLENIRPGIEIIDGIALLSRQHRQKDNSKIIQNPDDE